MTPIERGRRGESPDESSTGSAALDWEGIRDAYTAHFLSVPEAEVAGTEGSPFYMLHFVLTDAVSHAYATFGASDGALGHELTLVAAEPSPRLGAALEAVARAAPAGLSPLVILPCRIEETPFEALFFVPPQDGTFALGKVGGEMRHALRAVPITRAEQALAEDDPFRLLEMLRAAYALVADPHRACLVDRVRRLPPALPALAALRRRARGAIVALGERMRGGPEIQDRASRRYRRAVRLVAGDRAALVIAVEETIELALEPYARKAPARAALLFGEFIHVAFATHPDALRLLGQVLEPSSRPLPRSGELDDAAAGAMVQVAEAIAVAVDRYHPREGSAAILARGKRGLVQCLETFNPDDEIPVENHAWAEALCASYEGMSDVDSVSGGAVAHAFRVTARNEALLELDDDPRPPLVRLREIAARLATSLFTGYGSALLPAP